MPRAIGIVLLCAGAWLAPRAAAATREEAAGAQRLIEQARRFPETAEKVDTLVRRGWHHEGFDAARVLPGPRGVSSVVTLFERAGVSRDGAERLLTVELVYVDEPGAPLVLLRPGDERAAEVLKSELGEVGEATATAATCDAGCNRPPCVFWGCEYISSQGFHYACFRLPSNPLGHYYAKTRRTGTTNPASCVGWWADYTGGGVACPIPNTTISWAICGYP